jgi:hypothetical protein
MYMQLVIACNGENSQACANCMAGPIRT